MYNVVSLGFDFGGVLFVELELIDLFSKSCSFSSCSDQNCGFLPDSEVTGIDTEANPR